MVTNRWCSAVYLYPGRLLAVILSLLSQPCWSEVTLMAAHIYPDDHPTAIALAMFSDQVTVRSKKAVTVKIFDAATGGNQTAIFRNMRNGSLELSVLSQGVITELVPEAAAFGLPFLFADQENAWRVLKGRIGEKYVALLAEKGFVVLSFWDIEVRHLTNSIRPVLKPGDIAGLTIRTPPDPLAVDVITALGGKPRVLNFSDIYTALQRHVVDGQENPVLNIQVMKFYEVQKFLSLTGHKYSVFAFLMTQKAWAKLSASEREIVSETAKEATLLHQSLVARAESEAYRVISANGMRITRVDAAPFVKATAKIYDKWYESPIAGFVRSLVLEARENK